MKHRLSRWIGCAVRLLPQTGLLLAIAMSVVTPLVTATQTPEPRPPRRAAGRIMPITDDAGGVIAFCSDRDGDLEIYLMNADGDFDAWLGKVDGAGNVVWTRSLGGPADDFSFSVDLTAERGLVVAGYSYSFGEGDVDAYVVRLGRQD